jgi:hypothetical protein
MPCKKVGLEINVEKTKYMLPSHHQKVGKNRDIKIGNRSFENVLPQYSYMPAITTEKYFLLFYLHSFTTTWFRPLPAIQK